MNVTITVSDQLYQQAAEVAMAEGLSVDQLFAAAFENKLVEFERLKERAARGSYEKFRAVMAKVPAAPPPDHDRL